MCQHPSNTYEYIKELEDKVKALSLEADNETNCIWADLNRLQLKIEDLKQGQLNSTFLIGVCVVVTITNSLVFLYQILG